MHSLGMHEFTCKHALLHTSSVHQCMLKACIHARPERALLDNLGVHECIVKGYVYACLELALMHTQRVH